MNAQVHDVDARTYNRAVAAARLGIVGALVGALAVLIRASVALFSRLGGGADHE